MSEYVNRDRLLHIFSLDRWSKYDPGEVRTLIMSVTPEDVQSVVHCKDCRHRDPEDHKCDCGQLERAGCMFPVEDDYFCAYGEMK